MKKDNRKSLKKDDTQHSAGNYPKQDINKLEQEADKERSRKPGSQSNSSDQHNSGRGGGK